MSDVWQGPGWWLASDGKWYPADAQPGGGADQAEATTELAAATPAETASTLVADPVTPAPATPEPSQAPAVEVPAAAAAPVVDTPPTPTPVAEPTIPVTEQPVATPPAVEPVVEAAAPPVEPIAPTEPPAATHGGWQAVEPDTPAGVAPAAVGGEWTEPAVAAADTPSLDATDDGWTSAYETAHAEAEPIVPDEAPEVPRFEVPTPPPDEPTDANVIPDVPAPPAVAVPDAAAPIIESPTVEVPTVPAPEAPAGTPSFGVPDVVPPAATPVVPDVERVESPEPLARDEAWRKPSDVAAAAPLADDGPTIRPAPKVVDLAIPPESPLNPEWTPPQTKKSSLPGIVTGVLVLLVIVGLALAIGWFFTRDSGDDVVDTQDDTTGSETTTATTESSAPSSAPEGSDAVPADDPNAGREVSVFELRAGDCIQGEIGSGQVQQLIKVDCSVPHEFEVYREALIDSSVTSFDEAAISAQAEEVCRTSLAAYIPPDDERNLKFKWFQPTEESWNQETDPDRVITCLLFDEDGPLTGRAA